MDDLLVELKSQYPNQLNIGSYLMTTHKLTSKEYPIYVDKLIADKLVKEPTGIRNKLIMSTTGLELLDKYGSWIYYIKSLDERLTIEKVKQELEFDKLKLEITNLIDQKQYNKTTRNIAIFASVISTGLLLIELIKLLGQRH